MALTSLLWPYKTKAIFFFRFGESLNVSNSILFTMVEAEDEVFTTRAFPSELDFAPARRFGNSSVVK